MSRRSASGRPSASLQALPTLREGDDETEAEAEQRPPAAPASADDADAAPAPPPVEPPAEEEFDLSEVGPGRGWAGQGLKILESLQR